MGPPTAEVRRPSTSKYRDLCFPACTRKEETLWARQPTSLLQRSKRMSPRHIGGLQWTHLADLAPHIEAPWYTQGAVLGNVHSGASHMPDAYPTNMFQPADQQHAP